MSACTTFLIKPCAWILQLSFAIQYPKCTVGNYHNVSEKKAGLHNGLFHCFLCYWLVFHWQTCSIRKSPLNYYENHSYKSRFAAFLILVGSHHLLQKWATPLFYLVIKWFSGWMTAVSADKSYCSHKMSLSQ